MEGLRLQLAQVPGGHRARPCPFVALEVKDAVTPQPNERRVANGGSAAQRADASTQAASQPARRGSTGQERSAKSSAPCNGGSRSCVVLDVERQGVWRALSASLTWAPVEAPLLPQLGCPRPLGFESQGVRERTIHDIRGNEAVVRRGGARINPWRASRALPRSRFGHADLRQGRSHGGG